jgi:hypothetical protein
MLKSAHVWLKANKIWFETVAASLLSAMAIVVSVQQSRMASKQTELLSFQTRIAEAQSLPQFEIAIRQKSNKATGKSDGNLLVINNRGGTVHDFKADVAYFLVLTAYSGEGVDISREEVATTGYFTDRVLSAAGIGELVTMSGDHNSARTNELRVALAKLVNAKKDFWFVLLDDQIVVRLSYSDILDRSHEEYYEAQLRGGGLRLLDDYGQAQFSIWHAGPQVNLWTVRADDLLKRVSARPVSVSDAKH